MALFPIPKGIYMHCSKLTQSKKSKWLGTYLSGRTSYEWYPFFQIILHACKLSNICLLIFIVI